MRHTAAVCLIVVMSLSVVSSGLAQTPGAESRPFGASLFHPVQYPDRSVSIEGIRVNAFYAVNRNVTGLDLGLVVPVNVVERDFQGGQLGAVNLVRGRAKGMQWGLVNRAKTVEGLQLGFINMTGDLYGLQIGLANFKGSTRGQHLPDALPLRFSPLVNWRF